MRLRGYVALEAALGTVILAVLASAAWAFGVFSSPPERVASAAASRRTVPPPVETPPAPAEVPVPPPAPAGAPPAPAPDPPPPAPVPPGPLTPFDGAGDAALLAPLRTGGITSARFNRGGSTVSLRLDLDSGGRAAFKPEQVAWQSKPRKEIAAYRLDRLFGFGAVSPAIGRELAIDDIYAVVHENSRVFVPRMKRDIVTRDDPAAPDRPRVAGVISWWIPEIQNAHLGELPVDSPEGIGVWRRYLKAGAEVPPEHRDLVRQISNALLFDFLIDNVDRWSGSNVKVDASGRRLYFMDNTMSFSRDGRGHRKGQGYLRRAQTFSRHIVTRLRAVTEEELRAAVEPGPDAAMFEKLLYEAEIRAVLARRDAALEYIDELIERHGEAAVLAFP